MYAILMTCHNLYPFQGFGSIGRQVAEALIDTKEVQLIAIVDNLTVYDMVRDPMSYICIKKLT
jgi:glyceraldehyde-3-phosphate dehydrogenase/erythrose-4-phosphate dehydrogenase